MPRARKVDRTRTKPLTVAALKEYGALDTFSPPGRFDPNSSWTHTYRIWLVGSTARRDGGTLRIERSGTDGDSIGLKVVLSVRQAAGTVQETKAEMECQADRLCTPRSWRLQSVLVGTDGQPVEITKVEETGVVQKGKIEVATGDAKTVRKLPRPFTSNWSLFEAVQRLPRDENASLTFSLLEDLDLLKKGQRLSVREPMSIELGGRTLRLHGYHQTGAGVLPYHYWLDHERRLLFAISGIRAYLLESTA